MALVGRPAILWLRGLGLFAPRSSWEVPLGPAFAATAVGIVACTLSLAVRLSFKRERALANHAALLLLFGAAIAIRAAASEPRALPAHRRSQTRPPADITIPTYPAPRVLNAP
jgi:hypothetical protein